MTTPTSNLQIIASSSPDASRSSTFVAWGLPLIALVVGIMVVAAAWFAGELVGLANESQRITAVVWIAIAVAVVLVLHFLIWMLGGYAMAERLFQRDAGTQRVKPFKRDARLQNLCDELRVLLGWRWRYRTPWLLVCGDDAQVNAVAPGLKQAGVLRVADTILAHPSPDGIGATLWREQLRRLRRHRPVDAVVQLVAGNQSTATATEWLRTLSGIEADLGWAAPVTFLHAVEVTGRRPEQFEALGAFVPASSRRAADVTHDEVGRVLQALEDRLAQAGIQRCTEPLCMAYLTRISSYFSGQRVRIMESWAALHASKWRRATLAGVVLAPLYSVPATPVPVPVTPEALDGAGASAELSDRAPTPTMALAQPVALTAAWQAIGANTSQHRGRRVGIHARTVMTVLALSAIGLWIAGMLASGLRNGRDLQAAQQAAHDLQSAPDAVARLEALDILQQQILRYEYRVQHHAPAFTRFGLNRDAEVLAALWRPYAKAGREIFVTPVVQDLEAALVDLSQLQTSGLSEERGQWALEGRNTLKAYLMLAQPERVEPAFLAQRLAQHWSTEARIPPGQKQDLAERFAKFYADHLTSNPDWRIAPRAELVAGARQTLLAVIGERNTVDSVYQHIIENAGSKYPDQTLAALTLGTDPRGLVRASNVVPGVFTRPAYEGYVEAAIENAAKRQDVANDWVIAGGTPHPVRQTSRESAADFRQALTERYFADYAEHWQHFMNGMQWAAAATLPGVVDQLKLMADARQSPLIALMKSLEYQGGAGARQDSLSDTLVAKARGILGKQDEIPEAARPDPAGPLAAAFGPVLRLVGQSGQGSAGSSELSLQRYLERITAVRLRLQQMGNSADADALARQVAQSLFQGKGSDLAETRAYAQLMAASLGAEWAGLGDTLFVRPIAQAEQAILQPAQASLNEAWRQSIALPWNRAFAGRYPFADSANDASLPELARYIRPQSGLVNAFLLAELAGVLALQGDQWVPVGSGTPALTFDPAFLAFVNTLQRVGVHLLVQGDPQYRFELRPIPTPGLTDTLLTIDSQTLHYYNQRETWQAMTWPATNLQEPRTLLQWQTETAGTNKNYEAEGVWAWVRMLEHAQVMPIDSATVQLTFQAVPDTVATGPGLDDRAPADGADRPGSPASLLPGAERPSTPADLVYPIRYQLRAAVGRGPLEALALRKLRMPERIFLGTAAQTPVPVRAMPAQRR